MNKKKLIREQLEASLQRFEPLRTISIPGKGWIRAIRDGLGMTARQLAGRLGIAQQAVARIEKDEQTGSVTIRTMQRIAEGLDCTFVYGLVPNSSLEETIRKQAKLIAVKRLTQASQTMLLENQMLSNLENKKMLTEIVDELVNTLPSYLWDKT
jgi:predicted DNA-binding mobile mystery protein A